MSDIVALMMFLMKINLSVLIAILVLHKIILAHLISACSIFGGALKHQYFPTVNKIS